MPNQKTILFLVLLVLAASGGFVIGKITSKPSSPQELFSKVSSYTTHAMFRSQSATIEGVVEAIEGSKITIRDTKDQVDTFPMAGSIFVSSPGASPSADLKKIELQKKALITLLFEKNAFHVVSIYYYPQSTAQ